ncbi:hypothetical protein OH77DRAFT_833591 [Trametes cingulata]|nr:hypothetical protein OH77DRAFT_833591 [Trametes cingulata]
MADGAEGIGRSVCSTATRSWPRAHSSPSNASTFRSVRSQMEGLLRLKMNSPPPHFPLCWFVVQLDRRRCPQDGLRFERSFAVWAGLSVCAGAADVLLR